MFQMRRTLIAAALLALLAACTPPPPASSATTAPPSASTAPVSIPTASPSPTVAATPITLPSTAQLSAPSGTVVWAFVADSRLFRSTDRGDTWQDRSVALPGSQNREIAFISDSEGWLATVGSTAPPCQNQSVGITHTTDGGVTWDPLVIASVAPSADPPGTGGAKCKERLSLADAQRGFLSAYEPNSAAVIYRTTDRGRTWSASNLLPLPPGVTAASGVFLRADRARAFGATLLVLVRTSDLRASHTYRSVDGGATWTYLSTIPAGEGAFAFVTATRWLQISTPGGSMETTDGGATWHPFTTDYSQAAPVTPEIVFGDPLVGYATVRGAIQRTVDGGAHWTSIKTPGT